MRRPPPDFFIVGQPKSGTTALAHALSRHAGVYVCRPKEPAFFCRDLIAESDAYHGRPVHYEIRHPADYARLFEPAEGRLSGEASTIYLYSRQAASGIHAWNPEARIIALFREPVSFVVSLHNQYLNGALEDCQDFAEAIRLEEVRKEGRRLPAGTICPSLLYYSEYVRYAEQLQRYRSLFRPDQVLTIVYDDFAARNDLVFREVEAFLGLPPADDIALDRVNERSTPRFRRLNAWARQSPIKKRLHKWLPPAQYEQLQRQARKLLLKPVPRPPVDPELEAELKARFSPEVERLSVLIGRDLVSLWGY